MGAPQPPGSPFVLWLALFATRRWPSLVTAQRSPTAALKEGLPKPCIRREMKPELAGGRSAAQPFAWGPSKLSLRKGPHSHSRAWDKLPALERGPSCLTGRVTSQETPFLEAWPEPSLTWHKSHLLPWGKGSCLCRKLLFKAAQQPRAQFCHFRFR